MDSKRKDLLQNAGTLVALVISIIAMATSIYEANILKSQQKSMVWPYMSIGTSYSNNGFSATAFNNGTGPAIVKSMEVSVDGKPVETMLDLVKVLMPKSNLGYDILRQQKINHYVFRPGEELEIIGFAWTEETRELAKLIYQRVRIRIGYESVLGDSWIYDSKEDTHTEGEFEPEVDYKN
ncbi:MAG: hypothetical protein AAGD88_16220 [Bacteroidota bacterium]